MTALLAFVISLVTVLICTPAIRSIGLHLGWIDHPGERKLHRQPIVRVGGIAIAIGTFVSLLSLVQLEQARWLASDALWMFVGIAVGGIGFFVIGLSDDILNLSPLVRLLFQGIISGVVWNLGIQVKYLPIPFMGAVSTGLLSFPITFLWLAGAANAINWLDGMDGLAAGVATLIALCLSVVCLHQHHPEIALIALSLAGATLGFLRYNAAPAKIFMGDGGSYLIGFVLAAVSAIGLMQEHRFTTSVLPFAVLAVPVIDMVFVITSRLLDKKSPFFPDQRHLHHRLLQMGCSRQTTLWVIYGLTLMTGGSAIALSMSPMGWLGVAGALLILSLTNLRLWQQLGQLSLAKKTPAV